MRNVKLFKIFVLVFVVWSVAFNVATTVLQFYFAQQRSLREYRHTALLIKNSLLNVVKLAEAKKDYEAVDHFLNSFISPEWFIGFNLQVITDSEFQQFWYQEEGNWSRKLNFTLPENSNLKIVQAELNSEHKIFLTFYFDENLIQRRLILTILQIEVYQIIFIGISALVGFWALNKFVLSVTQRLEKEMHLYGLDNSYRLSQYPVLEFNNLAQAFNKVIEKLDKSQSDYDWLKQLNQEIFDLINQPMLITKHKELITFNASAANFFGLSRVDCFQSVDHFNRKLGEIIEKFESDPFKKSIIERKVKLKVTSERIFDIILVRILGKDNLLALQIIDVTDVERFELLQRVQHQVDSLGTLASGVVHDLNNILSGLTGTTSVLKYMAENKPFVESEAIQKNIGILEGCSARALSLSRSLLNLSSRREFEFKPFDLLESVEEAVRIAKTNSGSKIEFIWERSNTPIMVMGDLARTEQVILNVLINSLHAMGMMAGKSEPEGVIKIEITPLSPQACISTYYHEAFQNSYVRLRIIDQGIGISKELQKKIFEPFFTTKSREAGSGLGLSLVQTGMFLQRGWVSIFSEEGLGTALDLFFLPAEPIPNLVKKKRHYFLWNESLSISEELIEAFEEDGISFSLDECWDESQIDQFDGIMIDYHVFERLLEDEKSKTKISISAPKIVLVHPCPFLIQSRIQTPFPFLAFPFFLEDLAPF